MVWIRCSIINCPDDDGDDGDCKMSPCAVFPSVAAILVGVVLQVVDAILLLQANKSSSTREGLLVLAALTVDEDDHNSDSKDDFDNLLLLENVGSELWTMMIVVGPSLLPPTPSNICRV
jgi:hypothetical protein